MTAPPPLSLALGQIIKPMQPEALGPAELRESFGFCGVNKGVPEGIGVHQIHSSKIVSPEEAKDGKQADGIISSTSGQRLVLKTADCLPVLFFADKTGCVVHAGWRGLAGGIINEASARLKDMQVDPSLWHVIVGPAICQTHYEVGPEVVAGLEAGSSGLSAEELALCIRPGNGDRSFLSLQQTAALQLIKQGVPPGQIHLHPECTYACGDKWHSYRRDQQNAGRNYSWLQCP